MRAFELYDATTIKEAVDLLKANAAKNARVVAGGSDLIGGLMKDWVHGKGLALPDVLVDITTVKDLVAGSGIAFADRGFHVLKGVPDEWRIFAVEN